MEHKHSEALDVDEEFNFRPCRGKARHNGEVLEQELVRVARCAWFEAVIRYRASLGQGEQEVS